MKRLACILSSLILLVSLAACSEQAQQVQSAAQFYYLRSETTYGEAGSVFAGEVRDVYGHTEDMNYLLSLYLCGPSDDSLYSPFPAETVLSAAEVTDGVLTITLRGVDFSRQSKLQQTISCACLAKTCLEIWDISAVRINTEAGILAGDADIVMTADSLVLLDTSAAIVTEAAE